MNEKETKQKAIDVLRERYPLMRERLAEIDVRLVEYYDGVCSHVSAEENDENDWHNLYEVLGAIQFIRMLNTYHFDTKKVQMYIRLREGEWEKKDGTWKHLSGGLKCPGHSGARHYRWQPFQVFVLASVFGFHAWVNTQVDAGTRELLPTEREKDGKIYDYRRVCVDYTCFWPRKMDKTGMAAYIQLLFFFFADNNAECYCCANSSDQSKLLFSRTRQLIAQLDNGNRIRSTQTVIDWKDAYKSVRDSSVRPLSAGGKTKDGMFAQLCCADEYGSAGYINNKSDMLSLVNVIESSMGPRREPLTFTTTTAGTITAGPFMEKLESLHNGLLKELDYAEGKSVPDFESDRRLCLCLEPDAWEYDEDVILTKKSLRRKVNPMLGMIAQHSSYDGWISMAKNDHGKMSELISKYFNHYVTNKKKDWIKPDEIRALQVPMRIDDCTDEKGWEVYVGSDFSKGDDLNGNSYLAVRWNGELGEMEFFADMDSYVSQEAVDRSPIRELYLNWEREGWLHIVPGKTFDPAVVTDRIIQLDAKGVNFIGFGYDPYNAKTVINSLSQWLVDIGLDPDKLIVPVRQNFANYSPAVKEFDYMLKRGQQMQDGKVVSMPMIHFSSNPLWPWEFGNAVLAESSDGMENLKPVKSSHVESCKMDNVQMLLSALMLYDKMGVR